MNLNNLNKTDFTASLTMMTEEIVKHLADNSVNKIERYINSDTNEQTLIIKLGQMKINEIGLRKLIEDTNNDLELIEDKGSVSVQNSLNVLVVTTKSKELLEWLKGCVNYDSFSSHSSKIKKETLYTIRFEFNDKK